MIAAASRLRQLKVTRVQGRRMYAHQRNRVPGIVDSDHRISVAIVDRSDARRQRGLNLNQVLVRIKTIDRDCAD